MKVISTSVSATYFRIGENTGKGIVCVFRIPLRGERGLMMARHDT